jgi:hypothetical protein
MVVALGQCRSSGCRRQSTFSTTLPLAVAISIDASRIMIAMRGSHRRHDHLLCSLIHIAGSHQEIARGQAVQSLRAVLGGSMSMWLGLLLGAYLLGIMTGIVGIAYVQSKARDADGYNPWEPK